MVDIPASFLRLPENLVSPIFNAKACLKPYGSLTHHFRNRKMDHMTIIFTTLNRLGFSDLRVFSVEVGHARRVTSIAQFPASSTDNSCLRNVSRYGESCIKMTSEGWGVWGVGVSKTTFDIWISLPHLATSLDPKREASP